MTASHGYFAYKDLVQTYSKDDLRYIPSTPYIYNKDSVAGLLQQPDFSIFAYLFRTAKMDVIADQEQFRSTLFVCPDAILRRQFGGDDFFMNLDRNSIVKLLNLHILPRSFNEVSLRSRQLSILNTREPSAKLTLINNGKETPLEIDAARNKGCRVISAEIQRSNGMVYVIDQLLLPENF
jgi:uncharacterized surface protein with fasciclin (FAS1) repeats